VPAKAQSEGIAKYLAALIAIAQQAVSSGLFVQGAHAGNRKIHPVFGFTPPDVRATVIRTE
jgi:hypothetical protein